LSSGPHGGPDGAAIAHTDSDNNLVLFRPHWLKRFWSYHPGPPAKSGSIADYIQEIRWDPSGKRLAFLMGSPTPKIYLVNADGTGTKPVEFHNLPGMDRDLSIRNFAWSPQRPAIRHSRRGRFQVQPCSAWVQVPNRQLPRVFTAGTFLLRMSTAPT